MDLEPAPDPLWDLFVTFLVFSPPYRSLHIRHQNKNIVSLIEIFNSFKLIPHAFPSKLVSIDSLNKWLKFLTFARTPNTVNKLLFAMTLQTGSRQLIFATKSLSKLVFFLRIVRQQLARGEKYSRQTLQKFLARE